MKKLFISVFFLVFTISVFAQPGDPAERLKREIDGLTAELGLSKEQVEKITPIVTESQKKQSEAIAKLRESGTFNREKFTEERNKMMEETDTALKAVLTAEQAEKLVAYRKKQAEERAERMRQRQQ